MRYSLLLFLGVLFLYPLHVDAEGGLAKPIVNINGQRVASEYLINTPLTFRLTDSQKTVIASLKGMKYEWQMGDSTTLAGVSVTHIYVKPGTYPITVFSKSSQSDPQIIDTFEIHLLPYANYLRPVPKITINASPESSLISLDFNTEIHFSAASSQEGSAPITKYDWDFGDKSTGEGREVTHKYWPEHYNAKPILRLTDQNGLSSQTSVELLNQIRQELPTPKTSQKPHIFVAFSLLLLFAVALYLVKRRSTSNPKSALGQ